MKITSKIKLFVLINLTLYLISFGLTQFYNTETYKYQSFNSKIKSFESSLLSTIIFEKDYAKHPDDEAAKKVLSNITKNTELLEGIIHKAAEKENDLKNLSKLLSNYKSKFMLLVKNNDKIILLIAKWDNLFKDFHKKSDQVAQEIDNIIGMTYLNAEDADPLYGSFAISNKNIINALSEVSLTVNKDLLLNNREKRFWEVYKNALATLNKERKNILALAKYAKKDMFVEFSAYAEKHLIDIEKLTSHIHMIWLENTRIISELDVVRKGMIVGEKGIAIWIQASLNEIREANFRYALISVFLILLVLVLGGVIILRSVHRPDQKIDRHGD